MLLSGLARAAVVASASLHTSSLKSRMLYLEFDCFSSYYKACLVSEAMQYRKKKKKIQNSSKVQKLRETLADSEGIVLAQSSALSKLSPLVREKGGWQDPSNQGARAKTK